MKALNTKIPKLAFPLILSNITTPLLGLSNTIVVGHLKHTYYLAAIGLGVMIFNFLYWGLGFFRMTTTGLLARAFGARDTHKINEVLLHSLCLAIIMGFALIIFSYPIFYGFSLLVHASGNVLLLVKQYYYIRILGAPAVLLSFVMIGSLVGIQKTRGPLIILSITNLLAVLLSILLVFRFHLNLKGVAWADVIAQYVGIIIGFLILTNYFKLKTIFKSTRLHMLMFKNLFHANRDVFIRTLCLLTVFSFFTLWSSYISVLILAVNTLLMNFFQLIASALGGFDNVAEALCGKAVGAKNPIQFKQSIFDIGKWCFLFSLLFSILILVFGGQLINLMTNVQSVVSIAKNYLSLVAALPLIVFMSFLLDGVAIGANLFREMRNAMLLTLVFFFLIWYCLSGFGNTGLWVAFLSFFILRAVTLGVYIHRFWMRFKLIL